MAARERQRDKQQGVVTRRLSWPTAVLAGGILLSLAANLAQAQPTAWGRIVAAVPPAAFLVAVSMIERRAARRSRPAAGQDGAAGEPSAQGRPSPLQAAEDEAQDGGQCRADATLSRLLPPSPPTRGSGCLQLHPAAATAGRSRSSTSIRTNSASWRTYIAGTQKDHRRAYLARPPAPRSAPSRA
jgi:hypothetical protein